MPNCINVRNTWVNKYNQDMAAKNEQIEGLENALGNCKASQAQLESTVDEKNSEVVALVTESSYQQEVISELQSEKATQQENVRTLEDSLSTSKAQFATLSERAVKQNEKVELINTALEYYNEDKRSTHNSYAKAKDSCVKQVINLITELNDNNLASDITRTDANVQSAEVTSYGSLSTMDQKIVDNICNSFDDASTLLTDALAGLNPVDVNVDMVA